MGFELKKYTAPDFTKEPFVSAPDAVLAPAPKDRTAPENYHATTIFPEYFKVNGTWLLAEESRMDCVAVYENGKIAVREFRTLKQGDLVFVGKDRGGGRGNFSSGPTVLRSRGTQSKEAFFLPPGQIQGDGLLQGLRSHLRSVKA